MLLNQIAHHALIARVASKGGTTEAALKTFQRLGFGKIVQDAVKADVLNVVPPQRAGAIARSALNVA